MFEKKLVTVIPQFVLKKEIDCLLIEEAISGGALPKLSILI